MSGNATSKAINAALLKRFGAEFEIDPGLTGLNELEKIAGHRSHRRYLPRPIEPDLLRLLCACALSAPSKSDLQQCDIIIVSDATIRKSIVSFIPEMPWINDAPVFLVFAANGQRLPTISKLRGKPFPNDHLDLFFNAVVDAAIALATFIRAAEAVGLGCCPISAIRDDPRTVSDLLHLPKRVIPVAGMCVGWPAQADEITPRLSLDTTVIENKYAANDLAAEVDAYDRRRAKLRPYRH
jgi:nitroreductase